MVHPPYLRPAARLFQCNIEIALRNTFLPIVLKLPAMQRRFMARIAGLS
jgi:hypothetical protein